MSCEIQLIATLEGINKFIDGEKSDHNENENDSSRKTLQSFKIAVSPTGEIVVFGKGTWLLICGSKWDPSIASGAKIKYSPNWHGHVTCKPGEEITSILCLPFFSQGQSTYGCADWTCIILGFSSGWIRLYTEGMQELACSILHEESITDIKCFYSQTSQEGKGPKQDNNDIYVLYKSVICVLNKSQLCQTLKNKRNQLAKGVVVKNNETEGYVPLDFKKYSFTSQEEVTGACFISQTLASSFNTFDHLVTASLVGGFKSHPRASPPQTSLILTSGRRPFVGFHYTLEGANSPVLTDVALAVASKIKNSVAATLPDWFNFGTKKASHPEKPKEISQDYAERLNCRFGLCDVWRQGQSVIVSPDGLFSAVTDSLGRVTLIDNNSGIAHRMWKGCRDAQCGFLQVQEDIRNLKREKGSHSKPTPRQGLFIVIYSPKKGLIEIFTTQNGRRVTSFKVTKFGRLLYTPGTSTTNTCAGGFNLSQYQVIFVSEEGFSDFSIPFHFALTEDSSKISRDLHVLRKLKMLLKMENNVDNLQFIEEIKNCAAELKTDEIRLQTIESMITYRNVTLEAFKVVLKVFLEAFESKDRSEPPPRKITTFAEATLNLLSLYDFLINLKDLPTDSEKPSENTGSLDSLSEQLRIPQNELDVILKMISQITEIKKIKQHSVKVAFDEKKSTKLTQYLSCFDFESFLNFLDKNEKEDKKENQKFFLNVKLSDREQNLSYLGEVFFKSLYNNFSCFDKWKRYLEKCCLDPKDLSLCLLSHWCTKKVSSDIFPEVIIFMEVLKMICLVNGPNGIAVEYNAESPWWKRLRCFLAESPFTIRGLFAALCCRSITIFLEQEREFSLKNEKKLASKLPEEVSPNEAVSLNNDWETMSKDSCQWDILIMQLQDVALLNTILSLNFKTQNNLPNIPFDFEHQSLASIQTNGTGRVSELVAKWLIRFGFEPSSLIDPNDVEFQTPGDEKESGKSEPDLISGAGKTDELKNDSDDSKFILDYLTSLKTRFPYSLTTSSLLGNMCWEYFAHWFKNMGEVTYLEAAVRYLEVIPSSRIKYGICYLSWNTYLEQKFEALAKIINRIGKVPTNKLCVQEIGLRNDQVSTFLKLISEVLLVTLHTDVDDKTDFGGNQEVLWQNSSSSSMSSLVYIAFAQPVISSDLILIPLQLSFSLLMMSALNLKQQKLFTVLFDSVEQVNFTLVGVAQPKAHCQNVKLKDSRTEFLKKCLTAAVQTIELVEYIPPTTKIETLELVPRTILKVEDYKKWLQLCFELASMWALPLDNLRRHQICELYSSGCDRLAEEVIPSVTNTAVLASQLLVIGGKRLKYMIQDSKDFSKKLTKLSANLSEWLHTLDLENFAYEGPLDDIEVLMRFIAKWLPEGHSDHKLAVEIVESLLFLKLKG